MSGKILPVVKDIDDVVIMGDSTTHLCRWLRVNWLLPRGGGSCDELDSGLSLHGPVCKGTIQCADSGPNTREVFLIIWPFPGLKLRISILVIHGLANVV